MRIAGFELAVVAVAAACAQANVPPATPGVTEPPVGRIVNPGDLHMECSPFADGDPGDTHVCTDWEIWTVTPSARVWATLCIGGVERLHTHLGDGTFEGSHAGRTELLAETQYRLRVRHRDSSGDPGTEWSGFGERAFSTGAASAQFPLETNDVASSPAPTWRTPQGTTVDLPTAAQAPHLRLENAAGELLLELAAQGAAGNLVTNPGALSAHAPVRVRVWAGSLSSGLSLPETDLAFTGSSGTAHTIYLPAMSVPAGEAVLFWVSAGGSSYFATPDQTVPDFSLLARGTPVPWAARQSGYRVEVMATGFQLPVNIAFVPNPGPDATSPLYYVTELYGTIKVVARNGTVSDYATGLLNFNPTGNFPGSGEQGVTGIAVDTNGDVYATMLFSSIPGVEAAPHYPKVVRFTSNDGGRTAATQTAILVMTGESQGQSHQISNVTFGPDDKLYVHVGDGFDAATAQNLGSFRGKILRLNRNGTAATDNPFYNASDGITARDYVFAYGFRNPFGGAWRQADGLHYEVENGPSIDRICQVVRARNYLWNGSDASMTNFAIYNWNPAVGPVNMAYIQPGTFGGSGFPASTQDHMFISESGPTWATGPQANGKRISEFVLDAAGARISGPTPLIEYVGSGKATVVGLAAGPDGLYFTDLYKDLDFSSPIDRGANVLRVRFVGDADFAADVTSGVAPLAVQFTDLSTVPGPTQWHWDFGDGTTSAVQHPAHAYANDGLYTVTLSVTGSAGLSVRERPAFIRVGTAPRIAMIGGSLPPTAADAAIASRLRAAGFDVTSMDDEPANRPSAAQIAMDYRLAIVSSTVSSANIAGEFRTAGVPMIFWENALLRAGRESLTDGGAVVGATAINVLSNTHPIMQGMPLGTVTVFNPSANMSVSQGNAGPGTQVLARRSGSATDGAIVVAEAGATVAGGYVTLARRVFLFFEDSSWLSATPAAQGVLDRSVCWALGGGAPVITQQPSSGPLCRGGTVTLSAEVQGLSPISYSWRRNGAAIAGAAGRTLMLTGLSAADAGAYSVVVTTPCGSTTSADAVLSYCAPDLNCDGDLNPDDLSDFITCFFSNVSGPGDCSQADYNGDGATDPDDLSDYITAFFLGC